MNKILLIEPMFNNKRLEILFVNSIDLELNQHFLVSIEKNPWLVHIKQFTWIDLATNILPKSLISENQRKKYKIQI